MNTLVYFASGPTRKEYQDLDFDRIILIDNCFKGVNCDEPKIHSEGKIICLGMDCLESITFLKKNGVKIDCFVSLNEGLYEGGGQYAINSDMFLGYAMPLFGDEYYHIMNQAYYYHSYKVSMDLPYKKEEILETDRRYISPFIFSKDNYHEGNAKMFFMKKNKSITQIALNSTVKFSIIHDSIWNYYDYLDLLVFSYTQQGQDQFFERIPKTLNIRNTGLNRIFEICSNNKIKRVGFTPWLHGDYQTFIEKIKHLNDLYPCEVLLFHLNKDDYKMIKRYE